LRRPLVAGNWKMNLDLAAARALVGELRALLSGAPPIDVAVCPGHVYLFPMVKAVADSPIRLGAQNCAAEPSGAFTGETSVAMIRDTGCTYVILGHSERRHTIGPKDSAGRVIGETDAMIAAKCRAVLAGGLTPIVCVGETLAERDANQTQTVLTRQMRGSLAGLDAAGAGRIVIAYEPVWAIGTGRNATPQQAQEAHRHLRGLLNELFGPAVGQAVRILYGGSVKADNARELLQSPDVDGALVGGASLKASEFHAIIEACMRAKGLGSSS
jgi:triosephosphate isomerase